MKRLLPLICCIAIPMMGKPIINVLSVSPATNEAKIEIGVDNHPVYTKTLNLLYTDPNAFDRFIELDRNEKFMALDMEDKTVPDYVVRDFRASYPEIDRFVIVGTRGTTIFNVGFTIGESTRTLENWHNYIGTQVWNVMVLTPTQPGKELLIDYCYGRCQQ